MPQSDKYADKVEELQAFQEKLSEGKVGQRVRKWIRFLGGSNSLL